MIDALAPVALGWSLLTGAVEIEAVRRAVFRRAKAPGSAAALRVLLVRPCAGSEPWLSRTLPSLAAARRSFSVTCRFAVAGPGDGALPAAREAATSLSAAGIDASVVLTAARAPNHKAAQLAAVVAAELSPHDIVMVADSDVDLSGADLDLLAGPLGARRELGAVWAPPVEVDPQTLGDRASAALLGGSLHAFPVLAGLDPGALVGKLFAVEASALREAGGFEALVSCLGEDMELARRLRAAGRAVEAAPFVARSLASGRTWAQVERRFARWITVIRAQRPALLPAYPILFFATLPVALLAAAALPGSAAAATAAVAVVLRLAVAAAAARASERSLAPHRLATDALLADTLLARAFVRAIRSRQIVWRGVALTVDRTGALRLADGG